MGRRMKRMPEPMIRLMYVSPLLPHDNMFLNNAHCHYIFPLSHLRRNSCLLLLSGAIRRWLWGARKSWAARRSGGSLRSRIRSIASFHCCEICWSGGYMCCYDTHSAADQVGVSLWYALATAGRYADQVGVLLWYAVRGWGICRVAMLRSKCYWTACV